MLYVSSQKSETERIEHLEVDGGDADTATFCNIDVSASPSHTVVSDEQAMTGMEEIDSNEMQSNVTSCHVSSSAFHNQTKSSGETTSTGLTSVCLTIKIEPSVDDQNESTSRQEHCHGSNRCATERDGQSVQYTASQPPISFSHRPNCPCRLPPSAMSSQNNDLVMQGQSNHHRRRRPGLSRLRRTELRRRSRTVNDVAQDVAVDVDGKTSSAVKGLGVDRRAPSDASSTKSNTALGSQNRVAISSFNSEVAMEPGCSVTVAQSITTHTQSTASVPTTMTTAYQSPEPRPPSENKSDETVTEMTNQGTAVEIRRLSISTESVDYTPTNTAGISVAVSTRSFDVGRMSALAPVKVWRTLDCDVVSLSTVAKTPVAVPFSRLLCRNVTQSVVADHVTSSGNHLGRLPTADPRHYIDNGVKWRHRGQVAKQSGDVMWRRVALTSPVLRCALTVLKYNPVALVQSPAACYLPRHLPIVYPPYRLLCYRPSSCV